MRASSSHRTRLVFCVCAAVDNIWLSIWLQRGATASVLCCTATVAELCMWPPLLLMRGLGTIVA